MYNLNYAPTTMGVQSWRENISGGTRTKKVEYHCSRKLEQTISSVHRTVAILLYINMAAIVHGHVN
jgi:hypothetical protein